MNGKLALAFCHLLKWDLVTNACPLSGGKRTWSGAPHMSAYDPKRTLAPFQYAGSSRYDGWS